ncbi:MAG: tol-pal system-associated acyl-CoA thioesterase [Betaproteobacteria bacterium]|jgi:acyl-CoA thioester hydrolase|nr:tol-pal system-associated acyl-CoA thioesterase [Betaproteobacteria bacterium]
MKAAPQARKTFRLPVRVYYEDTDAAGVVYYANYLRFMERTRTEWLGSLGFDVATFERVHGVVFVVHRVEIDYRLPARLGDRLDATLTLIELRRARMVALQQVWRGADMLTEASVAVACIDRATFRPARIPPVLHRQLEALA